MIQRQPDRVFSFGNMFLRPMVKKESSQCVQTPLQIPVSINFYPPVSEYGLFISFNRCFDIAVCISYVFSPSHSSKGSIPGAGDCGTRIKHSLIESQNSFTVASDNG